MKSITLTQPWGSLVAIGAKRIETRSWGTSYRGLLAIHAGKGSGEYTLADLRDILKEQTFAEALRLQDGRNATLADLPRSAIVAVCRLADCRPMMYRASGGFRSDWHFDIGSTGPLTEQERAFGFYRPGRWAWMLEDVIALDPVEMRGAQGLWDVPQWFAESWRQYRLSSELQVFHNGADWVVAEDPMLARKISAEHYGAREDQVEEFYALPGDRPLCLWDGIPYESESAMRTCAEWVTERGVGFLGSTEY